jgi:hypothetical protein
MQDQPLTDVQILELRLRRGRRQVIILLSIMLATLLWIVYSGGRDHESRIENSIIARQQRELGLKWDTTIWKDVHQARLNTDTFMILEKRKR